MKVSFTKPSSNYFEGEKECLSNNRIIYFDFLNILACIGVVCMHVCDGFFNKTDDWQWYYEAFVNHVCYWAVPVFFMLTGATLIGTKDSIKIYACKRIKRTVIPFLVWSIIGLIFNILTGDISVSENVLYYLNLILNTQIPVVDIYWFFIPLFAIYLCVPVLNTIRDSFKVRAYLFLIAYSFISYFLLPLLSNIGIQTNVLIQNPMAAGYLIYPLLGYILSRYAFVKRQRIMIYVFGVVVFMLWFGACIFQSVSANSTVLFMRGYYSLPLIIVSCAVFVFIGNWSIFSTEWMIKHSSLLTFVSSLSFGIYLVHRFFIKILTHILPNMITNVWPVIGPVLVYGVSAVFVLLLKRLPFLRSIV